MNDDDNISKTIEDGDDVWHKRELKCGIAFCQNKSRQWLVRWADGTITFTSDFDIERNHENHSQG